MPDRPASEETVVREYPNSTYLLEDSYTVVPGNLVLTNKRLIFLRRTSLSDKEMEELRKVAQENNTERMLQFGIGLHKKNLQIPLSSVVAARLKFQIAFPFVPRPYMRLDYRSPGKKEKSLSFSFRASFFKRLMMSEFPTLDWIRAIRKAVKKYRKTIGELS